MSEEHRRPRRIGRADSWTKREHRRWWHSARALARQALRRGEQPFPPRHRHAEKWDRT